VKHLSIAEANLLKALPNETCFDTNAPLFLSGNATCDYLKEKLPEGSSYKSAPDSLQVYSDDKGCTFPGVFTLLPREYSLRATRAKDRPMIFGAYDTATLRAKSSNTRTKSKKRIALMNKQNHEKYVVHGWYAARNQPGIKAHNINMKDETAHKFLSTHVHRMEDRAFAYIEKGHMLFLDSVKAQVSLKGMPLADAEESTIWSSMAFGKNVFLNAHMDEDYFWSLTSVITENYDYHSEVVNYFCFPTHGVCVALKPGDLLLFNPKVSHCISSICNPKDEVFCISMYSKTAVVSQNDNSYL
jgi:hypothetical protein